MAFLSLTFNLPGPVDRPVSTKSLERLLQRGPVHLTGCQHSQELCVPLGLISKQLEVSLQKTSYLKKNQLLSNGQKEASVAETRRLFSQDLWTRNSYVFDGLRYKTSLKVPLCAR